MVKDPHANAVCGAGFTPGRAAGGLFSLCLGRTGAAVIDRDTCHLGYAGVAIGHAVAPANRVVFQSANRRDGRANALEVATALTDIEFAELAGIARNALDAAAHLAANLTVFVARSAAAVGVASPDPVGAAGMAIDAAEGIAGCAWFGVRVAALADVAIGYTSRVSAGVIAPPLAVPAAGCPFDADWIAIRAGLLIGVATMTNHTVLVTGRVRRVVVALPFAVRTASGAFEAEGIAVYAGLVVGDTALTREPVLVTRRMRAGIVALPPAV